MGLREERRDVAREYRRLAEELLQLHSGGANVISRYDNNHVFELSWKLKEIASRILKGYPNTHYANDRRALGERQRDNLLARIFRDGGQKQDTYPDSEAAVKAADETVAKAYARLDGLQKAAQEASKILFFCAPILMDHLPGCAVKDGKGDPCDCEVMIPENDPKREEIRSAMRGLLEALKET